MANPYSGIATRVNGQVIQASWFNTIKETLVNNGAVKHQIAGTTAPTISNDDSEDYQPGSTWTDTTNDNFYVCVDASTGAAIWYEVADTSTVQTLTNKTLTSPGINGANQNMGTASNTNRILLASDTTTSLDLLTDTAGLIAYDTTLNECVINNGSGWQPLVTKAGTQTLTNKTLTSPAINGANLNIGTPSDTNRILLGKDTTANLDLLTDVAGLIAYDTTKDKVVFNDSSGWNAIGTGSGTGETNFISEKIISDYNTYDDGASTTPVDGTGGSPTVITVAEETVSPIDTTDGILNLKISKSAADGQGEGVSVDFTTRGEIDYASPQIIKVNIKSSTNYVDDDFGVYIYDKDNSALIYPNDPEVSASALVTDQLFEFQTSADADDYRLIFHCQTTNASAYDLTLTVSVGPSKKLIGSPITDFEAYTPTVTNFTLGNGTLDFNYRRIGDSIQVLGWIYLGSTSSVGTQPRFSLPSGLSGDTTKFNSQQNLGYAYLLDNDNTGNRDGAHVRHDANDLYFIVEGGGNITATLPFTWAVNDQITFSAVIPISGWGTNLQLSDIETNRDIVAEGAGNGGGAVTASTTNIDFTETLDTSASFDGTTFTLPMSGDFIITGSMLFTTNADRTPSLYVGGVLNKIIGPKVSGDTVGIGSIYRGIKGDALTIRTETNGGTLSNSSTYHNITIKKIDTNKNILSGDVVACRYSSNSGQSLTTAGNPNTLLFEDKEFDTHNMYNTGTGIAELPASGKYFIYCLFRLADAAYTAGQASNTAIDVNGSTVARKIEEYDVTLTTSRSIQISCLIDGVKGDQINIDKTVAVNASLVASSEQNILCIFKM